MPASGCKLAMSKFGNVLFDDLRIGIKVVALGSHTRASTSGGVNSNLLLSLSGNSLKWISWDEYLRWDSLEEIDWMAHAECESIFLFQFDVIEIRLQSVADTFVANISQMLRDAFVLLLNIFAWNAEANQRWEPLTCGACSFMDVHLSALYMPWLRNISTSTHSRLICIMTHVGFPRISLNIPQKCCSL